jgi:hypothetical protein
MVLRIMRRAGDVVPYRITGLAVDTRRALA